MPPIILHPVTFGPSIKLKSIPRSAMVAPTNKSAIRMMNPMKNLLYYLSYWWLDYTYFSPLLIFLMDDFNTTYQRLTYRSMPNYHLKQRMIVPPNSFLLLFLLFAKYLKYRRQRFSPCTAYNLGNSIVHLLPGSTV